jgi:hypothetical protein
MPRCETELYEILHLIKDEILKAKRPPEEVILDDVDLQNLLRCSKRKAAELREKKMITYMKPGKVYYKLSDVLKYLDRYKVESTQESINRHFKNF